MSRLFHCVFVLACSLGYVLAQPIITEFVASNNSGLRDEDNDTSDWIEIHNPAATALDLDGWYLTDNASQLTKWRIPAVTLPPNGYLVVFASGKNRVNPAAPLHTNFGLSAGGEYLGLVQPDGTLIASEYAPSFPAQQGDVSYGITQPVDSVTLLAQGSPARGLIPTAASDAIEGTSWRELNFEDSTWLTGSLGLGYNFPGRVGLDVGAMANVNGSAYLRVPFTVADPSSLSDLALAFIRTSGYTPIWQPSSSTSITIPHCYFRPICGTGFPRATWFTSSWMRSMPST